MTGTPAVLRIAARSNINGDANQPTQSVSFDCDTAGLLVIHWKNAAGTLYHFNISGTGG